MVDFSMIAGSGVAGFALFGSFSVLRNLQIKHRQNKSVVATADNVASSLRSVRVFPAVPHFKRSAKKSKSKKCRREAS